MPAFGPVSFQSQTRSVAAPQLTQRLPRPRVHTMPTMGPALESTRMGVHGITRLRARRAADAQR